MKDQKLEELKESLGQLQEQFRVVMGDISNNTDDKYNARINDVANYFYKMIDGLRTYLYRLEENLYQHQTEGHLPKIVGASKMNEALKVLGLDGDFKVEPRIIYADKQYVVEAEIPSYK